MNFNETPICPICEELMYLDHHVEYNGDDEYGCDEYSWQCANNCNLEVDTETEYGRVWLEPIYENMSEVL